MQRPLLIGGFMGAGKSTVGRRVAELAARPFVDLDATIEQRAGRTVSEIFADGGEPAFRLAEADALAEVLRAGVASVVALGGGALLQRAPRLSALDQAVVVTLAARPGTVLERTRGKRHRPLLDVPDPGARIAELLEQRSAAYAESHACIATDDRSRDAVAEAVLAVWRRDPLMVAAGDRSYPVDVGAGIAGARVAAATSDAPVVLLVTDRNVEPLHAAKIDAALGASVSLRRVVLEPGEEHKTLATLASIWEQALGAGADRKTCFVALGGGVVTDVAGFAAATWMRGVPWLAVPTTLLGMVDAAVGGKTAVDLAGAKNAVGAFWQPRAVVCDVETLSTEPERGYVSALAEVIKTALIGDPELLTLVEREATGARGRDPGVLLEMVRRSIRVKARIVSADERESGPRAWLNLGHTIGHALEAYGGYGHLRHGEAVSLGLVAALAIGERLGHTPPDLVRRTREVLSAVGLPTDLHARPVEQAVALIGHDKKRAGDRIRFVVVRGLGSVETISLPLREIEALARGIGAG